MNETQSLNPLLPVNFKLDLESNATPAETRAGAAVEQPVQRQTRSKTKEAATSVRPQIKRMKKQNLTKELLAAHLTKKLGNLKREKLKRVLISLGIAATVAALIVLMAKLAPLGMLLLLVLGVAAAMHLWDRIRYRPIPF